MHWYYINKMSTEKHNSLVTKIPYTNHWIYVITLRWNKIFLANYPTVVINDISCNWRHRSDTGTIIFACRTLACRRACTSTRRRYRSCSWRTSRCEVSCAVSRQHAPVKCMPPSWHVWRPWRRNTPPWRGTPTPSVDSTSGAWTTSPTRWSALSYPKRFIAMLSLPHFLSLFLSFCLFSSSPKSLHLLRRHVLHEDYHIYRMKELRITKLDEAYIYFY